MNTTAMQQGRQRAAERRRSEAIERVANWRTFLYNEAGVTALIADRRHRGEPTEVLEAERSKLWREAVMPTDADYALSRS